MPESTIGPEQGKTPPSYTREPAWEFVRVDLPPDVTMKPEGFVLRRRILVGSILTMYIASFVTFWIPFFNGLIGGAFGGFLAGKMKRALGAAVVNSIAVPATLALLYFLSQHESSRFFSGLGFRGWVILHVIGTFLGAISGAASRPLMTGEFLSPREPLGVSASQAPVPGAAPTSPATTTETVPPPPSEPVHGA